MKSALYLDYGINLAAACEQVKQAGIRRVLAWIGHDPARRTALGEHELYADLSDNDLEVAGALCPNDNLIYLANSRYGKKEAIKQYKQAILSAAEHRVPLLILDVLPTSDAFVESLREIVDYAKDNGILLCIRETAGADTVGLLTEIPDLHYCLDTARCLALGLDPVERVGAAGERLAIVLAGDIAGNDDAIGERVFPGRLHDFAPLWAALSSSGYLGDVVVTAQAGADADGFLNAVKGL